MQDIYLNDNQWSYDPAKPLGPEGGFGAVFEGRSGEGDIVAVKKLKLSAREAAHRELRVADVLAAPEYDHIIRVLDSGLDSESNDYFIVMDKADQSLSEYIASEGGITERDAVDVLTQILNGLLEVSDLTHRDLKPDNILFHDGAWKIADFGIARFVEESTSLRTLKGCLTPAYAAPEQWRLERSTDKTDIYALGCVTHALFTGNAPFTGPSNEDFREQHLNDTPSLIDGANGQLQSLANMMMRKNATVRPSASRCLSILQGIEVDNSEGGGVNSLLANASATVSQEQLEREARQQAREEQRRQRIELRRESFQILHGIKDTLFQSIAQEAPAAVIDTGGNALHLGSAWLRFIIDNNAGFDAGQFRDADVDIVSIASIYIEQNGTGYRWGANLIYAKQEEDYRWSEVGFWSLTSGNNMEPFAIDHFQTQDLDYALSRSISHSINVAYGPFTIDYEDADSFLSRWKMLVAKAATGQLQKPNQMPIPPSFFSL